MRKLLLGPALVLLGAAFQPAADTPEPTRYVFDRSHTQLTFVARHMLVTNVRGSFSDFDGELMIDAENLENSSVTVTIQTASVSSGNERRDADLRSANFCESDAFPIMTFESTRVETGADGNVLVGNLTIRVVTKEVRIPFELRGPVETSPGQKRVGFEGALTVNRFDYGLKWDRAIETGGLVVSEDVKIELNVEASTPRQR
jgi:polyisoprenoid-binding protein YceI